MVSGGESKHFGSLIQGRPWTKFAKLHDTLDVPEIRRPGRTCLIFRGSHGSPVAFEWLRPG